MKLLFDQNLSFRLCRQLADLFPGSTQVQLIGLTHADDRAIWDHARVNGFVIVSLDADFADLAALMGPPPKVIGCAAAISRPQPSSRSCASTHLH